MAQNKKPIKRSQFIEKTLASIALKDNAAAKDLERNRMREFSANINDSLLFKLKQQAYVRGMEDRHKTVTEMKVTRREKKKQQEENKERQDLPSQFVKDSLSTRNVVTLRDVERCRDVVELNMLYIKRQKHPDQRLHAGGSLYYIDEAFNAIRAEEQKRPNSRLTELQKNRLALKYAHLMQDNDVKTGLVESFKIDTDADKRKQERINARKDLRLDYVHKKLEKRWEAEKQAKDEKQKQKLKRFLRESRQNEHSSFAYRLGLDYELDSPSLISQWSRKKSQEKNQNASPPAFAIKPQMRSNSVVNIRYQKNIQPREQRSKEEPKQTITGRLPAGQSSMREAITQTEFRAQETTHVSLEESEETTLGGKYEKLSKSDIIRIQIQGGTHKHPILNISDKAVALVTRNTNEQRIPECADKQGEKTFFMSSGRNKSMNEILLIDNKGQSSGSGQPRERALKQASIKSSLLTQPITSSTKASLKNGASSMTLIKSRRHSPSSTGRFSSRSRSPTKLYTQNDENDIFHKPNQQRKYQCAIRGCKCWTLLKNHRQPANYRAWAQNSSDLNHVNPARITGDVNDIAVTAGSVIDHMQVLTDSNDYEIEQKSLLNHIKPQFAQRTASVLDQPHQPSQNSRRAVKTITQMNNQMSSRARSVQMAVHRTLGSGISIKDNKMREQSQKRAGEEWKLRQDRLIAQKAAQSNTLHNRINSIRHLCSYALNEGNTNRMNSSLEFKGMPIGFADNMYLKEGERPESARTRGVAVINPHHNMLGSHFDQSDADGQNPLIKYFEDFTDSNTGSHELLRNFQNSRQSNRQRLDRTSTQPGQSRQEITVTDLDQSSKHTRTPNKKSQHSKNLMIIDDETPNKNGSPEQQSREQITQSQRENQELQIIQAKLREIKRKKRIQKHLDEKDKKFRDDHPEIEHDLLENLVETTLERQDNISQRKANKFLKQKVIENSQEPNLKCKMSAIVQRRQKALKESRKRSKEKFSSDFTEAELAQQYEALQLRGEEMTGKVNILIDRIQTFDDSESALKVSRMDITRKAKKYSAEHKLRMKECNQRDF